MNYTETYSQFNREKHSRTKHQATPTAQVVDNPRADYCTEYANGVETTGETVLCDFTISGLAEKNWRISRDGLMR